MTLLTATSSRPNPGSAHGALDDVARLVARVSDPECLLEDVDFHALEELVRTWRSRRHTHGSHREVLGMLVGLFARRGYIPSKTLVALASWDVVFASPQMLEAALTHPKAFSAMANAAVEGLQDYLLPIESQCAQLATSSCVRAQIVACFAPLELPANWKRQRRVIEALWEAEPDPMIETATICARMLADGTELDAAEVVEAAQMLVAQS